MSAGRSIAPLPRAIIKTYDFKKWGGRVIDRYFGCPIVFRKFPGAGAGLGREAGGSRHQRSARDYGAGLAHHVQKKQAAGYEFSELAGAQT